MNTSMHTTDLLAVARAVEAERLRDAENHRTVRSHRGPRTPLATRLTMLLANLRIV